MEDRPYRDGMAVDKVFSIIRFEFAQSISGEIFAVIEKNKDIIVEIVERCQKEIQEKYNKLI